MSGTECDDSGTFSATISWNTVIDSSTVITANNATTVCCTACSKSSTTPPHRNTSPAVWAGDGRWSTFLKTTRPARCCTNAIQSRKHWLKSFWPTGINEDNNGSSSAVLKQYGTTRGKLRCVHQCYYYTLRHSTTKKIREIHVNSHVRLLRNDYIRWSFVCCVKFWHKKSDPSSRNLRQSETRKPASADRTARRQFQAVFPVITGSFPTNAIAHLHDFSMDLTVGRTVGPTVDSKVGWTVGLTVKLRKHWFDSRSNYWSNCGNHWPTSEPNAG